MTEIDVTFIRDILDPRTLSASPAELGPDAGRITWSNCLSAAREFLILPALDYDEVRDHVDSFGAWEREEIDGWSELELRALLIQDAAAGFRELEAGGEGGRIYVADDGRLYLWLGE